LSELDIFIKGYVVTFTLIIAIGAQNAYLLKLGLQKQHVITAALFCALSDFLLISIGVLGLGFIIQGNQLFINGIAIFGIIFLIYYAYTSFKSALKDETLVLDGQSKAKSLKQVLGMLFVFTYLNPHAYLDTILLIGGIGANIESNLKIYFLIGAVSASTSWFFSLTLGARFLIPYFKKAITWKILDTSIGIIMLVIAYSLVDLIK
jgi:L-lysine exporter family protein LysE/ArgO